jgi:hypothetical protein
MLVSALSWNSRSPCGNRADLARSDGYQPWLVVWAAVSIMIVLRSATVYHPVRGEVSSAIITLVMFVLAMTLAYIRWQALPIRSRTAA